jgi:hypothetical protein
VNAGVARCRIEPMSQAPNDTRSAAEKARNTAGIVGSLKQEGYVPTPEAEAVHQRVARGEITSTEAIRIFGDRALNQDTLRDRDPGSYCDRP